MHEAVSALHLAWQAQRQTVQAGRVPACTAQSARVLSLNLHRPWITQRGHSGVRAWHT